MIEPHRKLQKDGNRLWSQILTEVVIADAASLELLQLACEALDRAVGCKKAVDKHGELVETSTGTLKSNPALADELKCRIQVARLLAQLGLDSEPARVGAGRPPMDVWPVC